MDAFLGGEVWFELMRGKQGTSKCHGHNKTNRDCHVDLVQQQSFDFDVSSYHTNNNYSRAMTRSSARMSLDVASG